MPARNIVYNIDFYWSLARPFTKMTIDKIPLRFLCENLKNCSTSFNCNQTIWRLDHRTTYNCLNIYPHKSKS